MKTAARVTAVSLFTAGLAGTVVQLAPPVSNQPPATAPVPKPAASDTAPSEATAAPVVPALRLQWDSPGVLRLNDPGMPVASVPGAYGEAAQSYQSVGDSRPVTSVKLFENQGMLAEWSNDGRIRYHFAVPNPLDAGVGAQLNSNAVKMTLTWPRKR